MREKEKDDDLKQGGLQNTQDQMSGKRSMIWCMVYGNTGIIF